MYDVVIAGAGPAGLTAALYLGRSRRRVLVADTNQPRNAGSPASHGFFTRDGASPSELRRIGREQLASYPSISLRDTEVVSAYRDDETLVLSLADGERVQSRSLVLATGVRDELPAINGLAEQWGRGVFHCPYCHGWEVRDQPIAMLVDPKHLDRAVPLMLNLSQDIVVLTNGASSIPSELAETIEQRGDRIVTEPIAAIESNGDHRERIVFESGQNLPRRAMMVTPTMYPRNDLARQLGCDLASEGIMPGMIVVDQFQQTSVSGVFAAGDIVTQQHAIFLAVASGSAAGVAVNHSLPES